MSVLKVPVSSTDHIEGNPTAPLILVEYGDYECPYCGEAYPVVKQLQTKFGQSLAFVFRNFPLVQIHPQAEPAAEAAEAAGAQGKFWPMHDMLYQNQQELGPDLYVRLGQTLGLNMEQYEQDMANHAFLNKIKADFMSGVQSGVNGTPTFFINGQQYKGRVDVDSLSAALEAVLKQEA